ncbi:uncharacterized protein LOC110024927, partial [Phalaenopsis equestris]|uniref:uncharacterized protein LOC110024927 n=1 Tax=Phalaenopsis equestris TaxID=78828 RepID=UPI0009E32872
MKAAMVISGGSISPRMEIAGISPSFVHDTGLDSRRRSWSKRMSLDVKERRELLLPTGTPNPLRRVRSDTDLHRSAPFRSRWSPPVRFQEEEEEEKVNLQVMSISPAIAKEAEELVHSGGGMGNGRKMGGGSGWKRGDEANREEDSRIGSYYQEMLKSDPGNPLLLRNYGRFLHEVKGDFERAEEYYG